MSETTPTPEDERFSQRAGGLLRDQAEQIDAATQSRLRQARASALAELPTNRRNHRGWWLPVASAAAVGALAVGLWLRAGQPSGPDAAAEPMLVLEAEGGDLEILLASSDLEMIEDVDFYAWADAELSPDELGAELDGAG
jgi:hypothetical protein